MSGDTYILEGERDRILAELSTLEDQQSSQADRRRELEHSLATASTDNRNALTIELDQLNEAASVNDRLVSQKTKRVNELIDLIHIQKQSDMI